VALIWLSQTRADGPTLLCVPGTMCSPGIFTALAGEDGPGCPVGAAPWLEWPGPHDMTVLGATVAELAAGLSPVVLVGHSTGGVIALSAALQARPGTVAGIVLCDTGANMHGHGDVDAIIDRVRQDWGPPLWEQVVQRSVHLEPDAAALADLLAYPGRISPVAVEQALRSQRGTDLLPELDRLAGLPALVVHGRHDAARPVSHAERLAAALPGAELVVLDCGHSPPVELPGQFNAIIVRWLAGVGPCPA
jgi:3-oxoadipate enol-lactonase